jgi:hypothetical protein
MGFAAAAENGTVFLVCHSGDGAGVDDIAVAIFCKGADRMPPLCKQLFHSLGLVLIDLAAQGVKAKAHSLTSCSHF